MKIATYKGKEYLYLRMTNQGRELVDQVTGQPVFVNDEEIESIRVVYLDFSINRQDLFDRPCDWLQKLRDRRAEAALAPPKSRSKGKTKGTKPKEKRTRKSAKRKTNHLSPEILENLKHLPEDVREATIKAITGQ